MNRTVVISVTILAVAAVVCFIGHIQGNRYTTVNAGNGRMYRVDRRTGKTVLIYGNREMPVGQDRTEDKGASVRELTPTELSKLTGRAGLFFGDYYKGSVYNGNDDITVTGLRVNVTTTVDGKKVSRSYQDDVSIGPQTTADFAFDIIVGDQGASYEWFIAGATGRPQP